MRIVNLIFFVAVVEKNPNHFILQVKKEGDKENETTNKPNGEVEASPELSKSAKKKKNKNKNKEVNGAGDPATEKSPQKPVAETKTPQKPAKEDTKTPKKGEAEAKKTPAKTPAKRTLKGGIFLEELKVRRFNLYNYFKFHVCVPIQTFLFISSQF